MAKKKTQPRRVPRTAEPRMYGDGKPSQVAQPTNGTTSAPASTAAAPRPVTPRSGVPARPANLASRTAGVAPRVPVTVTSDYSYVLKDLRRLGMLAAAFFVMLVALGLIIR